MSEEEPWDAEKVAAECAATAREKTRGKRRPRPGEPPPIPITSEETPTGASEFRTELGRFKEGHGFSPKPGEGGAPSKYKPEFVDQVRRLAQIGATNPEMADFFEVALSTFHLWRNVYPEFNEAVKVGKEKPDDRTERSLFERANGYTYFEEQAIKVKVGKDAEKIEIVKVQKHAPPDPVAMIFWLTNRRADLWRHKRTIEHSGTIEHVTPDDARRALLDYFRSLEDGEIIDVTPIPLAPPESEEAGDTAPASP